MTLKDKTATAYEHYFGSAPRYGPYLHVFGEAAVVHLKHVATKKMDNRGKLLMFVGNSPQHAGDLCRMFDADTSRVLISRDVRFINKMFYRSDLSRTALVGHPNDIILNRMHLHPTPQSGGNNARTMEELEAGADDEEDPGEDSEDPTEESEGSENTNPSMPSPATREDREREAAAGPSLRTRLVAGAGSEVANDINETQSPIATPEEKMAMLANVMALNQYMGPQPTFHVADAHTSVNPRGVTIQYQDDAVEWRVNTSASKNNERENDEVETIESMPSLEPREEEEENETVSTIASEDEFSIGLPKDDEDDPPDLPIPVRDETQDDLQDDTNLVEHQAPPSDVMITETESVSVLEGVNEANSKEWKKAKMKTKTPHTVTRAGRR